MKAERRPIDRRPFRAAVTSGEALAIDPGGGGLLASAIQGRQPSPQAFGFLFEVPRPLGFDPKAVDDGVAVLRLRGPLEHHDSGWSHSYEALAHELAAAALEPSVKAMAIRLDSPGGVAAGMGEIHRSIRLLQKTTGKPIYAFADEMACSAAYCIASACTEVWTTEAGHLGSVGVILCTVDESEALEKSGLKVRYVVSGARKADGHPGNPVTAEVLDVAQAKVDKLAGQFFRAVASARARAPGGKRLADPDAVRALQAGVFVGDDAMAVGLADGIASWADFLGYVKGAVGSRAA